MEVIGVERSLQCFSETAQVQESGGVLISDGNKKCVTIITQCGSTVYRTFGYLCELCE